MARRQTDSSVLTGIPGATNYFGSRKVWTFEVAPGVTCTADVRRTQAVPAKMVEFVSEVRRGLALLRTTPLIEGRDGVNMWRYRTHGDRFYVETLCDLSNEHLGAWRSSYDIDVDDLCWHRSMPPSEFRYMSRCDSLY